MLRVDSLTSGFAPSRDRRSPLIRKVSRRPSLLRQILSRTASTILYGVHSTTGQCPRSVGFVVDTIGAHSVAAIQSPGVLHHGSTLARRCDDDAMIPLVMESRDGCKQSEGIEGTRGELSFLVIDAQVRENFLTQPTFGPRLVQRLESSLPALP